MGRSLAILGFGVGTLLALLLLVSGIGGLFQGHGDPEAGRGRLHDAFVEEEPCNRVHAHTCGYERSVKLDLPDGETEVLNQEPLYDLVKREGPVSVDIEWKKDLGSATRVRYQGRWYRAGHPEDANVFSSLFAIAFGGFLLWLFGLNLLGRLLPD
jgi:hypothetical protein